MNFFEVIAGTPSPIGTLLFNYVNLAPGPFSTIVTSSAFIGTGPINSPDFIRVTGSFFVYGDPSTINVESIPEPSALCLLGVASLGMLKRRRRIS